MGEESDARDHEYVFKASTIGPNLDPNVAARSRANRGREQYRPANCQPRIRGEQRCSKHVIGSFLESIICLG